MVEKLAQNTKWSERVSYNITTYTELFFYVLGRKVATKPKTTIAICWGIVILASFGFIRYHQEKNPMKLWVPPTSSFVENSEWLMKTFQRGYRIEAMIIEADDVLQPKVLQELALIEQDIRALRTSKNVTLRDICFQLPMLEPTNDLLYKIKFNCDLLQLISHGCYELNMLELWDYMPRKLKYVTKEDILHMVNKYKMHPLFKNLKNYEDLLGGVVKNESGHIVSATSLHTLWMVNVNFSAIDIGNSGNMAGTADWASDAALDWEKTFLDYMKTLQKHTENFQIFYTSARSFGDITNSTMFQDFDILSIGAILMIVYVQLVISKYNWVEGRVLLGFMGLTTVGMAFVVGCGFCSLIGISYGPVHTSLPFLLMGLGVDDMFVILSCWEELPDEQKKLPLHERIGTMLKHAGVSITVTTVTDMLAFFVGAYTVLPSLRSYCLYAAAGVLMTFAFSITFFVACFALDEGRVQAERNCCFPCIKYKNYQKNKFSQKRISKSIFEFVYSRIILTWPGKLLVGLITIILLGFSMESLFKLEQRFDPLWFVPSHTHLFQYVTERKALYPQIGAEAGFYMGGINYTHELRNIVKINKKLENYTDVLYGVRSWVHPYRQYVLNEVKKDIYEEVITDEEFHRLLADFLYTNGTNFQANFQFESELKCGEPAPKIQVSSIDFRFKLFSGPEEHVPAMRRMLDLSENSNFTTGDKRSFIWSLVFASWITDEVIEMEVYRNMILALVCVMFCTAILIVNIQICFWIFVCVLLTMINVAGFMQRWDMTIEVTSCIGLQLAIGLCVDYATHIGHTFLTISEGNRNSRALKTVCSIGAAVFYGGFSTLMGVSMLCTSDAYAFKTFFKIFFMVTIFGLFHGVVLLPVILSWIGPKPYKSHRPGPQDDVLLY